MACLKAPMTSNRQSQILHLSTPAQRAEQSPDSDAVVWNTWPTSFRWLSTCAAFADSGGLVSGDGVAQRLFESASRAGEASELQAVSLVARWIAARSVVTVMGPEGWMLPMFQFDLATSTIKPSMAPVLAVLRGVFNEAELALWFVSSNDWLAGDRPAMVMNRNLPGVLHAARADRYLARGH
jgi:hypothetical protein